MFVVLFVSIKQGKFNLLKLFEWIKFLFLKTGEAIWCYRCTSATPGCGDNFNWRGIGYLGDPCPEDNDICVKITEKRGGLFF